MATKLSRGRHSGHHADDAGARRQGNRYDHRAGLLRVHILRRAGGRHRVRRNHDWVYRHLDLRPTLTRNARRSALRARDAGVRRAGSQHGHRA